MHMSFSSKLIKLPILFSTLIVLLFGFLCTGTLHKVPPQAQTINHEVISLQLKQPCCSSIPQHLGNTKDTFLAIPREARDIFYLLIIGGFTLLLFFSRPSWLIRTNDLRFLLRSRLYIRRYKYIPIDNLQFAYAKGILNPKLY